MESLYIDLSSSGIGNKADEIVSFVREISNKQDMLILVGDSVNCGVVNGEEVFAKKTYLCYRSNHINYGDVMNYLHQQFPSVLFSIEIV